VRCCRDRAGKMCASLVTERTIKREKDQKTSLEI
jgi:hypothetical protein